MSHAALLILFRRGVGGQASPEKGGGTVPWREMGDFFSTSQSSPETLRRYSHLRAGVTGERRPQGQLPFTHARLDLKLRPPPLQQEYGYMDLRRKGICSPLSRCVPPKRWCQPFMIEAAAAMQGRGEWGSTLVVNYWSGSPVVYDKGAVP